MPATHPSIFSAIDLFQGLDPRELDALASCAVVRNYRSGEDLFLEGEPCAGIHFIESGAVKIVKTTPSGRQLVLAVQSAPATVAEVPVFDGGPYPATVTATEPVRAYILLRNDFRAFCKRNPDLALRFLEIFGSRLRTLVSLVERITFGNVRQRLAQRLLEFAANAASDAFTLPETHEELAAHLGTVREVVTRNLGRFQSEGLIRMARRDIAILDESGLRSEADTEL